MLSANPLNWDKSKILLSGKGLMPSVSWRGNNIDSMARCRNHDLKAGGLASTLAGSSWGGGVLQEGPWARPFE